MIRARGVCSPRFLILAIALILSGAVGCAISASSTSADSSRSSGRSSDSSSASSASSSGSSSGSSADSVYKRDVRDYTAQWLKSGGDIDEFNREVGKIAKKRGITNWEQDEETYVGIGRGLEAAGVEGARVQSLKMKLGGSDPQRMQWIDDGFHGR